MLPIINLYQTGNKDIVCISRNENNEMQIITINDFNPYFYYEDENGTYTSIFGKKLSKKTANSPFDVKTLRSKYTPHYEADIPYLRRFLIDRYDTIPKCSMRILYFDIETANTNYDVAPLNDIQSILSIACYDSFRQKYIVFFWGENKPERNIKNINFFYDSEIEMLQSFIDFVVGVDFDLLVAYNGNNFDVPYLYERCKRLSLNFESISMNGKIKNSTFKSKVTGYDEIEWDIPGRYTFDMLRAIKYLQKSKERFDLHSVCMRNLGYGKVDIIEKPFDLWKNNPDKLIEYNLQDVKLMVDLDKKLSIIDSFNERRLEWGCLWEDLWKSTSNHDAIFLRKARHLNVVLPSKRGFQEGGEKRIGGGFVLEPQSGIFDDVVVFDFKNLYGSLIRTFNVSPECIDAYGEIKLPNGVNFTNIKRGIIPLVVEDLQNSRANYVRLRDEFKADGDMNNYGIYNSKQDAMKEASNRAYGNSDNPGFRLFDKRISSTITFMGQYMIKKVINYLSEKNYKVLYSDTDSVVIQLNNDEDGNIVLMGVNNYIQNYVTEFYGVENFLKLNFDKAFSTLCFIKDEKTNKSVKKRYFGYDMDNNLKVTGFEMIRSDASLLTKEVQQTVMRMILEKKTKKEIQSYIIEIKHNCETNKYPLSYVALPKTYNRSDYKQNNNPYLLGRKWSEEFLGMKFSNQSKLLLVYVQPLSPLVDIPHSIKFRTTNNFVFEHEESITDEIKQKIMVDWKKQFPPLMDNTVEKLLSVFGNDEGMKKWF